MWWEETKETTHSRPSQCWKHFEAWKRVAKYAGQKEQGWSEKNLAPGPLGITIVTRFTPRPWLIHFELLRIPSRPSSVLCCCVSDSCLEPVFISYCIPFPCFLLYHLTCRVWVFCITCISRFSHWFTSSRLFMSCMFMSCIPTKFGSAGWTRTITVGRGRCSTIRPGKIPSRTALGTQPRKSTHTDSQTVGCANSTRSSSGKETKEFFRSYGLWHWSTLIF